MRNPRSGSRRVGSGRPRNADRAVRGLKYQPPPRSPRQVQSPSSHADPSTGAPA
ncbi:MAG: hypothetical protein SFV21_12140 [Rhodospirillaceae bacterium]|nr:hypothetical protein [Rhodospirillaceae bacterium]